MEMERVHPCGNFYSGFDASHLLHLSTNELFRVKTVNNHFQPIVPSAENARMDSGRPSKFSCEQEELIEIVLRGFCLFCLSNFKFGFHGLHLKKSKIMQLIFEQARVVNNKDNRVFMSRNYRSGSCPLQI